MNVKTSFLNGELDEEIYMEKPEGFEISGQKDKVCKLNFFYMASNKHQSSDMRSLILPRHKRTLLSMKLINVYTIAMVEVGV
jgi:hypothetical protein